MSDILMRTLSVGTADGLCPVHLHHPAGTGPWPGVLFLLDGPGIRPALHEMAARLAAGGYAVILPDLFYRGGAYAPIDPRRVWADPELKAAHRVRFMETASPANAMADLKAIIATRGAMPEVAAGPLGMTGYCMGGKLALIAAATFPDQIAVAASYHGGGLATDAPSSPHHLAPNIRAKVYVAGAIEDANFTDAMKAMLETALAQAGVDHQVETYPAHHGWVPRDMPAHDPAEAEHHWRTLVPLLDGVLKRS